MNVARYHLESPGSLETGMDDTTVPAFDAMNYLTFDESKVKQHTFESLVKRMRGEIFRPETLDNHLVTHDDPEYQRCANVIRGYAEPGTFNHALWTAPETIAAISRAAGLDVVPVMNMEIGHINVQTAKNQTIDQIPVDPTEAKWTKITEEEKSSLSDKPLDGWHKDSYPAVCIVMLSDSERMIGGETAIKKGDGTIQKIKSPGLGHAVFLAGRYTEHAALQAIGGERIVSVTSFRAKNVKTRDDSHLGNVMYMAHGHHLYNLRKQFVEYRMKVLSERMMNQAAADVDDFTLAEFIMQQVEYLQTTHAQAFPQPVKTEISV